MSKNRMHTTAGKKKKDPLHCGTITVADQLNMSRAGRRQAQIESGIKPGSGSGVHGGGKREQSRRDRQKGRQAIREGRFDD